MRKLATVRRISALEPIPGADLIELAHVDGWQVVVAKDVGHKVGDWVIYCEIDSFLPVRPEFEFLRKSSFKKMGDQEGFRLKTIRLRGQVSQGLILPYSVLGFAQVGLGQDVSDLLGIVKYEPPIPAELAGKMKGNFPSFIPKTDEERVQNLDFDKLLPPGSMLRLYMSEKLEGSSATFYVKDGEFGVCSRNIDLLETEGNSFWKVARSYNLPNKMLEMSSNFAIQGELIGEGVQGNHYGLTGQDVRLFSGYWIDDARYMTQHELDQVADQLGLERVPKLGTLEIWRAGRDNQEIVNSFLALAEEDGGWSEINPNVLREGIVFRTDDKSVSFKAISNKYLLNQKD